ncbi:Uncharacterized protein TCM_013994 [Theobroma cacao]|uniref:Uncharacterized protein n=1 Tax=Theobroma cacao TaxID=3641 RepID=A0A061FY89_THECC|nr:Uncharacterized protein TCM_013994 [Theobroma cacao]
MTPQLNQLEFMYKELGVLKKVQEIVQAWKKTSQVDQGKFIDEVMRDEQFEMMDKIEKKLEEIMGHSIEKCTAFKHKVQGLIKASFLNFEKNPEQGVNDYPLLNHARAGLKTWLMC